jgi:hypothetical protein
MSSLQNRAVIDTMMQNQEIIQYDLLYRPQDTNFGKATNVSALFLNGLMPSKLSTYAESMATNFYEKKLWLGSIKTAQALDINNKVLYEVVYSTIVDDLETANGTSIDKMMQLPFNVTAVSGNSTYWVYPNSIHNMQQQLASAIPQIAPNSLPLWMSSKQKDGTIPGFTLGWVICYTQPGASEKIAYRLRQEYSDKLNLIYFTANRVVVDQTLSINYNKDINQWNKTNIVPESVSVDVAHNILTTAPVADLHGFITIPALVIVRGQPVAQSHTVAINDRILVQHQQDVNYNGLYIVDSEGKWNKVPASNTGSYVGFQSNGILG